MMHIFLVVLLSLVGTSWSLPLALDEALIHLGKADINLSAFYKALEKKDLKALSTCYKQMEADRTLLKSDAEKLQSLVIKDSQNEKTLKRILEIQLDQTIFKLSVLIPDPNGDEKKVLLTAPAVSPKPAHKAEKPALHAHTPTLAHAQTHAQTKPHAQTPTHAQTKTHVQTPTHAPTHAQTPNHAHASAHAQAPIHAQTPNHAQKPTLKVQSKVETPKKG